MKHPGKIVITGNKVKFEYYELEKPDISNYDEKLGFIDAYYDDLKKYEASKRVIEVNNVIKRGHWLVLKVSSIVMKEGEFCKAKIKNNIATIIKIS